MRLDVHLAIVNGVVVFNETERLQITPYIIIARTVVAFQAQHYPSSSARDTFHDEAQQKVSAQSGYLVRLIIKRGLRRSDHCLGPNESQCWKRTQR